MQSDVPLDYAVFQMSPRRLRCELFVSYDGTVEKLASGLLKPFVTHLKVAEEQVALARKSIKLVVEEFNNAATWFTKGTLERFVRFVSTPEVLEMVNTFDTEMSQLEAAQKIYSKGAPDDEFGTSGGVGNGTTAASDATMTELLRAIDVRLSAIKQDLTRACSDASAAGFNPETVSRLRFFADHFGAHRLSKACSKFITTTQRRADLFNCDNTRSTWNASSNSVLLSSTGSNMSLDDLFSEQPMPSTCTTSKVTYPSRRFFREPSPSPIDDVDKRESSKDKALGSTTFATTSVTESASTSSGKPQLTRRLSVQEKISLFENKAQISPSTTSPTSTSGKPEHRRLSSDFNLSTDKAVLRRWSGTSDMSIDVSEERKEPDSNANTPTPSAPSPRTLFPPKSKDLSDLKSEEGDKDSKLPVRVKFGSQRAVSSVDDSGLEESVSSESNSKIPSLSLRTLDKDQSGAGFQSRVCRTEEAEFENQSTPCPTQIKSQPGYIEKFGSSYQCATEEKRKGLSSGGSIPQEQTGNDSGISTKNQGTLVGIQGEANNDVLRDQKVQISHFSGFQGRTVEGDLDSATSEVHLQPVNQCIGVEAHLVPAQPRWSFLGEVEKVGGKDFESLEIQTESHSMPLKTSGLFRGQFQGNGSGSGQVLKRDGRKESGSKVGGSQMGLTGKCNQEAFSSVPMDQVQRVRQPNGNQGVNDELKMKACELEKLFAEHKLRVPSDQSNSAWRVRPAEMAKRVEGGPNNRKQETRASPAHVITVKSLDEPATGSNEMEKFYSTPLLKTVVNHDYDVTPKHNMYSLSFSDDSRGKLYQTYMQKRDAKLREDWSSNRPEKETQMKALQDSLEESRAKMNIKLGGSADKRNSAYDTRRKAEKMRLFMSDNEDEGQAEFLGKKRTETFLRDSSAKSAQRKRVQQNKNASSPATRNSTASIPRSSSERQRLPYDNPLAQSVPNFSYLRKENTKPSSAGSNPVRPQGRIHARKKIASEDLLLVKEKKAQRSQSSRKSTATITESNNSHNSDDTQFMPFKYHSETEDYVETSNDMEPETLLRKASVMGEAAKNEHGFCDTNFGTEEMVDETTVVEESTYNDNSKGRLSNESDNSGNSGYENSGAVSYVSQAGMGSTLDSPGESPGPWNSRLQNAFTSSYEMSDIDASDSPSGSPASWNFHTRSQSEAEAASMSKKWGVDQKPIVGIDSSPSQSRKDITIGLRRFLKFGRKKRASESMSDWISITTSEGDDSEDGRDLAIRSSEDLRKSRMGFLQSHNSDEGFNRSDLFNEQVQALRSPIPTPPSNFKTREERLSGSSLKAPKSFFSLSNFRSKANDSKPR